MSVAVRAGHAPSVAPARDRVLHVQRAGRTARQHRRRQERLLWDRRQADHDRRRRDEALHVHRGRELPDLGHPAGHRARGSSDARNVQDGGIVRVSNFNISGSASTKLVVDALVYAMQTKHATVKIVMDEAQNNAMSKTTWLAMNGAQVKFLNGLSYTNSAGPSVGIMHSKIVAVDDQIVFTGSNNFSATGFITNEENSVVLRAPENGARIASFICDID